MKRHLIWYDFPFWFHSNLFCFPRLFIYLANIFIISFALNLLVLVNSLVNQKCIWSHEKLFDWVTVECECIRWISAFHKIEWQIFDFMGHRMFVAVIAVWLLWYLTDRMSVTFAHYPLHKCTYDVLEYFVSHVLWQNEMSLCISG